MAAHFIVSLFGIAFCFIIENKKYFCNGSLKIQTCMLWWIVLPFQDRIIESDVTTDGNIYEQYVMFYFEFLLLTTFTYTCCFELNKKLYFFSE